jgi:uncharacterized membrane protein
MNPFIALLQRNPLVFVHLATAGAALVLGIFILARRKGTGSHKALGWAWVALMGSTALATVFIRDFKMFNVLGYTPIHLFTLSVAISLPLAIWHIKRGNVSAHQATMKGVFIGGCVLAGIFTLVPGRFLGQLLWQYLV